MLQSLYDYNVIIYANKPQNIYFVVAKNRYIFSITVDYWFDFQINNQT